MIWSVVCLASFINLAWPEMSGGYINVARNGTADAAVAKNGAPQRAIDGVINGNVLNYSCYRSGKRLSSNNAARDNVWQVILLGGEVGVKYPVSSVSVFSRNDAKQNRIDKVKVMVDDFLCGQISWVNGITEYKINCNKTLGSLVSLRQVDTAGDKVLELCEVKVWVAEDELPTIPSYTNVALNKTTKMSREKYGGVASRAVDGGQLYTYPEQSCTFTDTKNNWWSVDLEEPLLVDTVVIRNRVDSKQGRIEGAEVFVKNGEEKVFCGSIAYNDTQTATYIFKCAMIGNKVLIRNTENILTLCEVEVLVLEEEPTEGPSEVVDEDII